jgi:uncharacterized protein YndB with AHSA1/START domain
VAAYHFVTVWRVSAPAERVWDVLTASERYGEWWPAFVAFRDLTPGVSGVGERAERVVRGRLPYSLRYITTVTLRERPREVAYDSEGDLVGRGRFVLEPDGDGTRVTYHWDVGTTRPLLNALAPLLRPLFAWNHDWVMAQGERGLARRLAVTGRAHAPAGGDGTSASPPPAFSS